MKLYSFFNNEQKTIIVYINCNLFSIRYNILLNEKKWKKTEKNGNSNSYIYIYIYIVKIIQSYINY